MCAGEELFINPFICFIEERFFYNAGSLGFMLFISGVQAPQQQQIDIVKASCCYNEDKNSASSSYKLSKIKKVNVLMLLLLLLLLLLLFY